MASIKLNNVYVDHPIFSSASRSLQSHVLSTVGGKIDQHKGTVIVHALKDINLSIHNGDRIGIIGHNGAGKTTLLRVIAQVYPPTHGSIEVDGNISSFTDITLGMDPDATGAENIIFRLVFMGLSFKEARAKSESIADFSELGEFLNVPVRTYSTGMYLRLAFAISTSIEPDIIVMDEMIGAGDANFIKKAEKRLKTMMEKTKILVLATHDTKIMNTLCNKVMWLDHGEIRHVGNINDIMPIYQQSIIK
jgi:ABC-type polysaccharide/polyol phosphate transport system ATPase subunit